MNNDTDNDTDTNDHVDENAGIWIDEFLKIHDPESGEVLYEGRI